MSWQVRYEGSPTVSGGLTGNQVVEGINEGVWELTDEVRGPNESKWVPLEDHPFFAEAIADYEGPKRKGDGGEEHLDMNPLIDVALVLLIFFILTTSYDALRKVIDMPVMARNNKGQKVIKESDAKALFTNVKATMSDKKTVFEVDGTVVAEEHLKTAIEIGVSQSRNQMIIEVIDVNWDTVIKIIDAGRQARVSKFMMKAN